MQAVAVAGVGCMVDHSTRRLAGIGTIGASLGNPSRGSDLQRVAPVYVGIDEDSKRKIRVCAALLPNDVDNGPNSAVHKICK